MRQGRKKINQGDASADDGRRPEPRYHHRLHKTNEARAVAAFRPVAPCLFRGDALRLADAFRLASRGGLLPTSPAKNLHTPLPLRRSPPRRPPRPPPHLGREDGVQGQVQAAAAFRPRRHRSWRRRRRRHRSWRRLRRRHQRRLRWRRRLAEDLFATRMPFFAA
nr:unnamed protein product [Digitaria exilis]